MFADRLLAEEIEGTLAEWKILEESKWNGLQLSINLLRCAANSENKMKNLSHDEDKHQTLNHVKYETVPLYVCICVCIYVNTQTHV